MRVVDMDTSFPTVEAAVAAMQSARANVQERRKVWETPEALELISRVRWALDK